MRELPVPAQATAQIEAMLGEHGLTDSAVAVAFFSFESPRSFIAARDPDGRLTPLIGFWPLPLRGADLLEEVASIDENGPRLIANYTRSFPALVDSIRAFGSEFGPMESESLGWLLGACSLVMGMDEEDVARALGPIQELVKVDTVVVEHDERYIFDSRRLLRSLMSYRIGAVAKHVVARSVFESLGDYAANAIRRLLRDWKVEVVICAGDLFARNVFLAERTRRGLVRPKLAVYFPTEATPTAAGVT